MYSIPCDNNKNIRLNSIIVVIIVSRAMRTNVNVTINNSFDNSHLISMRVDCLIV